MPIRVFLKKGGGIEEWLEVTENGAVTHRIDNLGWATMHGGVQMRAIRMSLDEAKKEWPAHAAELDRAAVFVRRVIKR